MAEPTKRRGRPPGSKNRPKEDGSFHGPLQEAKDPRGTKPGKVHEDNPRARPGDNSRAALTDDEMRKLHLGRHVPDYKRALEAKKEADAEFKNVCKRIKLEGGSVADVKRSIELQTEKGIEKAKVDVDAVLRVMRWNGLPVGTQASLFAEPDRRPIDERAYEEGKIAGMAAKDASPPYDGELGQKWMQGWHDGQAVNHTGIKQAEPEPGGGEGPFGADDDAITDAADAAAPDVSEASAAGEQGGDEDPGFGGPPEGEESNVVSLH